MVDRLELGKRYHCRDLTTADNRTGIFRCDADSMEVQLFDYEKFFFVDDGAPVFLRLENNLIVSMHGTISNGPGHSSYNGASPVTTYYSGAIANVVVVGQRKWEADDPVRRVWFSIPHTNSLVEHQPKLKAVRAKRFPSVAATDPLFEVAEAGITVRCWYRLRGSWEFGTYEWEPIYEVEYNTAQTLATYLSGVHILLQFFSMLAGFQLTPTEFNLSPLTHAEAEAVTDWRENERFSVEYYWPSAVVETPDLHPSNSFANAWDRSELASLKSCLRAWINRYAAWEKAATLMMGSLGLVKQTSGQRLLMAARWLERIPGSSAQRVIDDETVQAIAVKAAETAAALNHPGLDNRIAGALRSLRTETKVTQFERLVSAVHAAFDRDALALECFDQRVIPHLMQANAYRGQEAHSFVSEGAATIRPLYAATTAMEALCYLLTIKDLPMSKAGRARALSNRLVRSYRYARLDEQTNPESRLSLDGE